MLLVFRHISLHPCEAPQDRRAALYHHLGGPVRQSNEAAVCSGVQWVCSGVQSLRSVYMDTAGI